MMHCGLRTSGGLFPVHSWCLLWAFIHTRQASGDLSILLVFMTRPLVVIRSHLASAPPLVTPLLSLGIYQESERFRAG
jgi:hypothetical protein